MQDKFIGELSCQMPIISLDNPLNKILQEQNIDISNFPHENQKVINNIVKISTIEIFSQDIPRIFASSSLYIIISTQTGIISIYSLKNLAQPEFTLKLAKKISQILLFEQNQTFCIITQDQLLVYQYQKSLTGKNFKERYELNKGFLIAQKLPSHQYGVEYTDREQDLWFLAADQYSLHIIMLQSKLQIFSILKLNSIILSLKIYKLDNVILENFKPFYNVNKQPYTLISIIQLQEELLIIGIDPQGKMHKIYKVAISSELFAHSSLIQKDGQIFISIQSDQSLYIFKLSAKSGMLIDDLQISQISKVQLDEQNTLFYFKFVSSSLMLGFGYQDYYLIDIFTGKVQAQLEYKQKLCLFKYYQALSLLENDNFDLISYNQITQKIYISHHFLLDDTQKIQQQIDENQFISLSQTFINNLQISNLLSYNPCDILLNDKQKYEQLVSQNTNIKTIQNKYVQLAKQILQSSLTQGIFLTNVGLIISLKLTENNICQQYLDANIISLVVLSSLYDLNDYFLELEYDQKNQVVTFIKQKFASILQKLLFEYQIQLRFSTVLKIQSYQINDLTAVQVFNSFNSNDFQSYLLFIIKKKYYNIIPALIIYMLSQKNSQSFFYNSDFNIFKIIQQLITNYEEQQDLFNTLILTISYIVTLNKECLPLLQLPLYKCNILFEQIVSFSLLTQVKIQVEQFFISKQPIFDIKGQNIELIQLFFYYNTEVCIKFYSNFIFNDNDQISQATIDNLFLIIKENIINKCKLPFSEQKLYLITQNYITWMQQFQYSQIKIQPIEWFQLLLFLLKIKKNRKYINSIELLLNKSKTIVLLPSIQVINSSNLLKGSAEDIAITMDLIFMILQRIKLDETTTLELFTKFLDQNQIEIQKSQHLNQITQLVDNDLHKQYLENLNIIINNQFFDDKFCLSYLSIIYQFQNHSFMTDFFKTFKNGLYIKIGHEKFLQFYSQTFSSNSLQGLIYLLTYNNDNLLLDYIMIRLLDFKQQIPQQFHNNLLLWEKIQTQTIFQLSKCFKKDLNCQQILFINYDDNISIEKQVEINQGKYGIKIFNFLMRSLQLDIFISMILGGQQICQKILNKSLVIEIVRDLTNIELKLALLSIFQLNNEIVAILKEQLTKLVANKQFDSLSSFIDLLPKYVLSYTFDVHFCEAILLQVQQIESMHYKQIIMEKVSDLFINQIGPQQALQLYIETFKNDEFSEVSDILNKIQKAISDQVLLKDNIIEVIQQDIFQQKILLQKQRKTGIIVNSKCLCGQSSFEKIPIIYEQTQILYDGSKIQIQVQDDSDETLCFSCGHSYHYQCLKETNESIDKKQQTIEEILLNDENKLNQSPHRATRILQCPQCQD